jgi:hypothetical protein
MDNLLPNDSRRCSNPGCPEHAAQGLIVTYTEGKVFHYCGQGCATEHRRLLVRHFAGLKEAAHD